MSTRRVRSASEPPLRLTSWRIRNFKSVESADVDLAGLTVLVGGNSAGKSSLIQSILLFLQAQAATLERPDYMPLNGPRVQLGSFDEVRFERVRSKHARIGLGGTLSQGARGTSFTWMTEFGPADEGDEGRMRVVKSTVEIDAPALPFRGRLTLKRRSKELAYNGPLPIFLWRDDRGRRLAQLQRESPAAFSGEMEVFEPAQVRRRVAAGLPDRGLPGTFLERRRLTDALFDPFLHGGSAVAAEFQTPKDREIRAAVRSILRRDNPGLRPWDDLADESAEILVALVAEYLIEHSDSAAPLGPDASPNAASFAARSRDEVDPILTEAQVVADDRRRVELRIRATLRGMTPPLDIPVLADMPEAERFQYVQTFMRHHLEQDVAYLGPLRSTPRVSPNNAPGEGSGVGTEGEFTAAVLRARRRHPVTHCHLGSATLVTEPLEAAVGYWMVALGLVDEVESRDQDRYGIEVLVRSAGVRRPLNLRNVGVGISQVLPVIVLTLLAERSSLVLLEQPELHLHPLGQQSLADFFIAMVRSGRQLIIETHSDHLVSRLRRRVAEDASDTLVDDIGFVFAERQRGKTTYRTVKPNAFGGLEQWPAGFMDQGPHESAVIIEAALRKQERGPRRSPE